MFKLDLEKSEELKIKLPTSIGSSKKQESSRKTSNSAIFSSVQLLSCVQLFATSWIAARQASQSITNSQSSLRLTSMKSVMPSSHLILCRPLLLLPPRWRIDAFELWCWRRLLRVPWTARRSNQSILKISPGISLEGMMQKLKLQYFGHLMRRVDSLEKTLLY